MPTPLEQNTTTMEAILAAVNALPEGSADPVLQEKIVDPSTSIQTVTPDSGYDGLSKVTVAAVPTATQATPSINVSTAGQITATSIQSAGYVAGGTTSATKQLTIQVAKTITPTTSSQTAVAKNVYTTGTVTVAAIPSTYVKPTATKAATTYTPTTSDQTIASGTYCSGTQTIKGDANLVAGNIKSGVSIFGVNGSYEGSGGGGGGSVETCTFKIEEGIQSMFHVYYTNGNLEYVYAEYGLVDGITNEISNVACNTVMMLYCIDEWLGSDYITVTGGTLLYCETSYIIIALNEVQSGGEVIFNYETGGPQ